MCKHQQAQAFLLQSISNAYEGCDNMVYRNNYFNVTWGVSHDKDGGCQLLWHNHLVKQYIIFYSKEKILDYVTHMTYELTPEEHNRP